MKESAEIIPTLTLSQRINVYGANRPNSIFPHHIVVPAPHSWTPPATAPPVPRYPRLCLPPHQHHHKPNHHNHSHHHHFHSHTARTKQRARTAAVSPTSRHFPPTRATSRTTRAARSRLHSTPVPAAKRPAREGWRPKRREATQVASLCSVTRRGVTRARAASRASTATIAPGPWHVANAPTRWAAVH
jgi:hypothetical protein